MNRIVCLIVVTGLSASAPAQGQAPCPPAYYYREPVIPSNVMPSPSPSAFTGGRYSFYRPAQPSSAYYAPNYNSPMFWNPRYQNPGPYYFTPTYSFTPGYYSYYYTPGYFRY